VKQAHGQAMYAMQGSQSLLRAIQFPIRGDEAAIFIAIRIAEHNLLQIALAAQRSAIYLMLISGGHDYIRTPQIVNGFE